MGRGGNNGAPEIIIPKSRRGVVVWHSALQDEVKAEELSLCKSKVAERSRW